MAKLKEKVSIEEILIDEIENSSTNDWDELCNACSSLIKDAKMTDKDIDNIVKRLKTVLYKNESCSRYKCFY